MEGFEPLAMAQKSSMIFAADNSDAFWAPWRIPSSVEHIRIVVFEAIESMPNHL